VLLPGWFRAVEAAFDGNYVVCGTYRKVRHLEVVNGEVKSFTPFSEDHRFKTATSVVSPCHGGWLFGCTVGGPTDFFLKVGGWPEFCDGLKSEDCIMGITMYKAGIPLRFDKRMAVLESEEHHHLEPSFAAFDKGISPNDKSHAAVRIAENTTFFKNYDEGGIPQVRRDVLAGKPFPITQHPQHDWYDKQPLSEIG
jgi:hypothetical protein